MNALLLLFDNKRNLIDSWELMNEMKKKGGENRIQIDREAFLIN